VGSVKIGVGAMIFYWLCLMLFILVSRENFLADGKVAALGLAVTGTVLFLWIGVGQARNRADLCVLPMSLTLGYLVAFHLTGLFGFHGLLRDAAFSMDYFLSLLRVAATVLSFNVMGTALFYLLIRRQKGDLRAKAG